MTSLEGTDPALPPTVWDRARRTWTVLVPVLFAIALAWFVWSERDTLEPVWEAPAAVLFLLTLLVVVGHFLNAMEFWLLYRATGAQIGLFENWMLFTAGQLANHLPARMGTLYRFRYMQAVRDVPYMQSAAVYGSNLAVTLAGAAGVGLLGVIATVAFTGAAVPWIVVCVFGGGAALGTAFAFVPLPPLGGLPDRFARLWQEFHSGFNQIRRTSRAAVLVLGLEGVKYLVTAWRFQVAFSLIGLHEPFWIFLVIAPAAGVAGFIGLTPAAFGFREAFITGAAVGMGLELTGGLLGATLDRAVLFAVSIFFGALGLLMTYPQLRHGAGYRRNSDSERQGIR